MQNSSQYSYSPMHGATDATVLFPILPFRLITPSGSADVVGLLDTGASLNVLPFSIGLQLGAEWQNQAPVIQLTGNLARFEARPLILQALIDSTPIVRLAFAWTRSDDVPIILGQVNFFMEFDACFYRTRNLFQVRPKLQQVH